ncbi:MAG: RimK/LysX family protein [Maribacter sp.]|nr:RimK/LysX family protein [Maribacter sp.]
MEKKSKSHELAIIGREEWCVFEGLGIPAIKARIDSGAKTSSLHAYNIEYFQKKGEEWVRFDVHPLQRNREITISCEAPLIGRKHVKSSSGTTKERPIIKVPITLGNHTFDIELNLASRDSMEFRMLLGREALMDRFVVNTSEQFKVQNFTDAEINEKYTAFKKKTKSLWIGLLSNKPRTYTNKIIIRAAKQRGHHIVLLDPNEAFLKFKTQKSILGYVNRAKEDQLDALIQRVDPETQILGLAMVWHYDHKGIFCLNTAEGLSNAYNAPLAWQLFAQHTLPLPNAVFAKATIDVNEVKKMVNAPLTLKFYKGTLIKKVIALPTYDQWEAVLAKTKKAYSHIWVQESTLSLKQLKIRCFIINGKIVASVAEQNTEETSAQATGAKAASIKIRISMEEKKLALKAAKILNLAVAGVDILRARKGPFFLGITPCPKLEGLDQTTANEIADTMILAIEKKLRFSHYAATS